MTTEENQTKQEQITEDQKALATKYGDRIVQWVQAHGPRAPLPVIRTAEGDWLWLNREQRKALLRARRKKASKSKPL